MSRGNYRRLLASLAMLALLIALAVAVGTAQAQDEEAAAHGHAEASPEQGEGVAAVAEEPYVAESTVEKGAAAAAVEDVVDDVATAAHNVAAVGEELYQEAVAAVQGEAPPQAEPEGSPVDEDPSTEEPSAPSEAVPSPSVPQEVYDYEADMAAMQGAGAEAHAEQQPEPAHEQEPVQESEQHQEPEAERQPEPEPEPEPAHHHEPVPEPESEPVHHVEPVPEHQPEAEPAHQTEPEPEPEHQPEPEPVHQHEPEPESERQPQQQPEPEPEPKPVHEPESFSEPPAPKPAAEKEEEEPRELRVGGSTIRWRAKTMQEGCVKGVEKYLRRIHGERRAVANAVTDARAALNEARVHHPKQVDKAERALEIAVEKLAEFDTSTVTQYGGDLPKTCIEEVEAHLSELPAPTSESDFVLFYTHFYRVLSGHVRLLAMLCRGEYEYVKASYLPMLTHFYKFVDTYSTKAKAAFSEAHPKPGFLDKLTGKQKEVPTKEFIKKMAEGAAYACVPLFTIGTIGVIAIVLSPVIVAAFIVPDVIYAMYVKLFLFYYTYGMFFPRDFVVAVKEMAANVQAKKWATVRDNALDAFLDMAGDNQGFYNGALMVATMFTIATVVFMVVFIWVHCCCFRGRGRAAAAPDAAKPRKSTASPHSASKAAGGKGKAMDAKKKN